LRRYLLKHGFTITSEKLTRDTGRIYPILTARGGGVSAAYSEAELYTGAFDLLEHDPLFGDYLDLLIQRVRKAAPYDPEAAVLWAEFESMKERLKQHDESK
jgi:tRNA A22 N-methylase